MVCPYLLGNGAQISLAGGSSEFLKRSESNDVIETTPISITSVTPEPSSIARSAQACSAWPVGRASASRRRSEQKQSITEVFALRFRLGDQRLIYQPDYFFPLSLKFKAK